jgi:hypothetical protein
LKENLNKAIKMIRAKDKRACLISIENDALLFASNGQSFSRLGVVAICASHLGTKHDYQPTDPDKKIKDNELIAAIREREIQTYRTNPDRITSDFRGEEETRLDYGGRAIWELLQNADDSMAPSSIKPSQFIGAKGIGFKSVLEISDEPEIHSGPFHFHFSSKKTAALLRDLNLSEKPPPLTFRIPFEKDPDNRIIELLQNYSTVIKLPFKQGARELVVNILDDFDHRVLIFCHYIEKLQILREEKEWKTWHVDRDNSGKLEDCDLTFKLLSNGNQKFETITYRRWANTFDSDDGCETHSAAICLPLNEKGIPSPTNEPLSLYVFFPTKEFLPFRALIHASFDLVQNRNYIRRGKSDRLLIRSLAEILKRIISQGTPPETILKAFVSKSIYEDKNLQQSMWETFKSILQKEAFIPVVGGHKSSTNDSKLWKYDIGELVDDSNKLIKDTNLVAPELIRDSQCLSALRVLGTEYLESNRYPTLLIHSVNETYEDCSKLLQSLYRIVVDLFTSIPKEIKEEFLETCRMYVFKRFWTGRA